MRLFGRRETLNEQLLREAGVTAGPAAAPAPEPELPDGPLPWFPDGLRGPQLGGGLGIPGIRGGPYLPHADDAVVTLDADIRGDAIQFVALPDGSLLVEEQEGDEDLAPFANAVETDVLPPYRARARRQEGTLWAVGAVGLDVRAMPGLPGEQIVVTRRDGAEETLVEGAAHPALPALDAIAEDEDFAVQAERLDRDWWELQVSAL